MGDIDRSSPRRPLAARRRRSSAPVCRAFGRAPPVRSCCCTVIRTASSRSRRRGARRGRIRTGTTSSSRVSVMSLRWRCPGVAAVVDSGSSVASRARPQQDPMSEALTPPFATKVAILVGRPRGLAKLNVTAFLASGLAVTNPRPGRRGLPRRQRAGLSTGHDAANRAVVADAQRSPRSRGLGAARSEECRRQGGQGARLHP